MSTSGTPSLPRDQPPAAPRALNTTTTPSTPNPTTASVYHRLGPECRKDVDDFRMVSDCNRFFQFACLLGLTNVMILENFVADNLILSSVLLFLIFM